jgi:hypothetical protein
MTPILSQDNTPAAPRKTAYFPPHLPYIFIGGK